MSSKNATATVNEAADTATNGAGERIILEIAPEDIAINPLLQNLRGIDYDNPSERFVEGLNRLAKSIKRVGQEQPILVRHNTMGTDQPYELVFGHRRLAAVQQLGKGWKVIAQFQDLTEDEALKAAAHEETQKEGFSPLALAKFMQNVRTRFKWQKDTGKVAEFFGVSPATITETEKLLQAPDEVKEQLTEGQISKTTALEVMSAKEGDRSEVFSEAQKIAKEKADRDAKKEKEKAEQAAAKAKAAEEKAAAAAKAKADKKEQKRLAEEAAQAKKEAKKQEQISKKADAKAQAKPKVEGKHVREALRKKGGDATVTGKNKAPNRGEILGLFEQLTGPAYPKLMQTFASQFLSWAAGELTDKKLLAAWDDIADVVPDTPTAKSMTKPAAKAATKPATKPATTSPARSPKPAAAKHAGKPKDAPSHAQSGKKPASTSKPKAGTGPIAGKKAVSR